MTTPVQPIVFLPPVARPEQPQHEHHGDDDDDEKIIMVEATRIDTEREQEINRRNIKHIPVVSSSSAVVPRAVVSLPQQRPSPTQQQQQRKKRNVLIAALLLVAAVLVTALSVAIRQTQPHHTRGHTVSALTVMPFDAPYGPILCLHDPSWASTIELQASGGACTPWYYRPDTQQLVVGNPRGTTIDYPTWGEGEPATTELACLTTRCDSWDCSPYAWYPLDVTACDDTPHSPPPQQQRFLVDDYGRIRCHLPATVQSPNNNADHCISYSNGGVQCQSCQDEPPSTEYRGVGQIWYTEDNKALFWPTPPQQVPPFPGHYRPSPLRLQASGRCLGPQPVSKPMTEWITMKHCGDPDRKFLKTSGEDERFYYKSDTQQLVRDQTDTCLTLRLRANGEQHLILRSCASIHTNDNNKEERRSWEDEEMMQWYGDAQGRIHCAGLEQPGAAELCLAENTAANAASRSFLSCHNCSTSSVTQVFDLPDGFWNDDSGPESSSP